MPVPSAISELSQTAGSNYPAGSESPTTADDYLRTYASYIAKLRDGQGATAPVTLASATTTDIGAQNSQFVDISGTTTITSFGTNYNGPRFLRFTGALVLTYNATSLILPTGGNITTVAGDSCIAFPNQALNGWTVVAYAGKNGQFATLNSAGNLAFSGTGNRITGDFSNATVASRVMFQTSTTNAASAVSVLPNGTATESLFVATNAADPTNASYAGLDCAVDKVQILAGRYGTGTYLPMTFYTGGSERVRIDTSGNLLVGTGTTRTNYSNGTMTPAFQIEKAGDVRSSITRDSDDASGPVIYLGKTRGTSVNSSTVVANGDTLGLVSFEGADGTNLIRAAAITVQVDGTPGANDMPGRLILSTTADGASGATERMRIDSSGNVLVTNAGGLGYGTGAGGTVTQATSKSTAVTLNKPTGQITMNNASLAASTAVEFVVNNSVVGADDIVVVTTRAGFSGYRVSATKVGAGSFAVELINFSAGPLAEAVQVKFAIIKGATA